MDNWMTTLFQTIGGIGVFLLALDMLSQGLRMASGDVMKTVLAKWTDTPLRGLFFGFMATAVLQSSSVVTAIVISLVNAAIMPLYNAIWTIFGTNIGTTITGWLISATGFDINLKILALPFIGVGMFMKLLTRRAWCRALGMAITGVGLFFVGIDFLKDAFSAYAVDHDFSAINQTGFLSLLSLVGIGIVMTIIIQSSTAAMVIILTGAASGMLTLSAGAALVIGANIGTTFTAIIAGIGASPNAKRTSATHVIFNVVTAAVVLCLMPFILHAIEQMETWFGIVPSAAVSLAIFHTAFSVIGVVIFWPFVPALTRKLNTWFVVATENDSKTKYLDRNAALEMPMMAIDTLGRELARLERKTAEHCLAIMHDATHALTRQRDSLLELSEAIFSFGATMTQENMDADTVQNLQSAFKINRYLADCLRLSDTLHDYQQTIQHVRPDTLTHSTAEKMMQRITKLLEMAAQDKRFPPRARQSLQKDYKIAKAALLEAGLRKEIQIDHLSPMMDTISRTHRMAEQLIRADKHLAKLRPEGEAMDAVIMQAAE